MEFATLSGSVLGFFTVYHKLKWSVNEGDLLGMPKNRMYQNHIKRHRTLRSDALCHSS